MSLEASPDELGLSEVEKVTSVVRRCIAGPNAVRQVGEYFNALEPNSFGLPSVDTCPGKTDYCEADCYAIDSEYRPSTRDKLLRNQRILEESESQGAMTGKLHALIDKYRQRAARLGIAPDARRFRIHWSGDCYSVAYAKAWRTVIDSNADIKFFAYTRSFQPGVNVIPVLAGVPNLDLFMSVDQENVDRAAEVLPKTSGVRIAYLVDYYEDAAVLQEKLGRTQGYRALACPENMRKENGKRKLALINELGGACARCTYCIDKPPEWDVVFVKNGYLFRAQGELPFTSWTPIEMGRRKKQPSASVAQGVGNVAVEDAQAVLF